MHHSDGDRSHEVRKRVRALRRAWATRREEARVIVRDTAAKRGTQGGKAESR